MDLLVSGSCPAAVTSLVPVTSPVAHAGGGDADPKVLAVILIAFAALSLLGLWFPSLRKSRRSPVEAGPLRLVALAIMLSTAAAAVLVADFFPDARRLWLVAPFGVGFVLAVFGHQQDKHRHAAAAADPARARGRQGRAGVRLR